MKAKLILFSGASLLLLTSILIVGNSLAFAQTAPATPSGTAIPNLEAWQSGPHAKADAPAFTHWSDANLKEVPAACAKCHTTTGYQDYLGADGSQAGKVDKAQPVDQVITCEACHNPSATALHKVTFPSGVEVSGLGPEARCMVCHQGNASKKSVDDLLSLLKADDPDAVPAPVKDDRGNDQALSFVSIHYRAAAASLYGGQVMGGYQYDGKTYDAKNQHVAEADSCTGCHNSHDGQVLVEKCQSCHGEQVKTEADLGMIRSIASANDYNGNGNVQEPIKTEIEGLQAALLSTLQAYAKEVAGVEIKYDRAISPYFMGPDGKPYQNWTPRLLKAAYNYHFTVTDPGIFAHNPKYAIELLYDSIADLNAADKLKTKTDQSKMRREDAGHFDGATQPFRHWDTAGFVEARCAKCHSSNGLPFIINNPGVKVSTTPANQSLSSIKQPIANGFKCSTCHDPARSPNRYFIDKVTFPSGNQAWFADADANLCLMCHQGLESTSSINAVLAGEKDAAGKPIDLSKQSTKVLGLQDPAKPQAASNPPLVSYTGPHYFAAGATLLGNEVQGAYQYANQKYSGRTAHPAPLDNCLACHDAHNQKVQLDKCATCHGEIKSTDDLKKLRGSGSKDTTDYDGDGNVEGYGAEIQGMAEALLAQIQAAATRNKYPIAYSATAYPYFFNDLNSNGVADPEETQFANAYGYFNAKLLEAAYNYQWVTKDPGAYVHNFSYVNQILYDSLKDLSGNVGKMKRAAVTAVPKPEAPQPPAAP
jgi:predicted CXXCH cytochrome family protein